MEAFPKHIRPPSGGRERDVQLAGRGMRFASPFCVMAVTAVAKSLHGKERNK